MGRLVAIVQIDGVTGLVVGNGCGSTGTTVGIVGQGVLRQCDFAGGDGEVDGDFILVAILDRQGRGTVEGVVATVLLGIDCRGVDLDGVGLGVGVISGGVAFGAFGVFVFFEILKLPIDSDGSAGDCIRGHAIRQRVVDRAAGKTGGDGAGNCTESTV